MSFFFIVQIKAERALKWCIIQITQMIFFSTLKKMHEFFFRIKTEKVLKLSLIQFTSVSFGGCFFCVEKRDKKKETISLVKRENLSDCFFIRFRCNPSLGGTVFISYICESR